MPPRPVEETSRLKLILRGPRLLTVGACWRGGMLSAAEFEAASVLSLKFVELKKGTDCSVPARMLFFPLTEAAVDRVVCPLF